MNILLLAMSTYPSKMKRCVASYGEGHEEYSYFSQVEPGCKHFIKKLGANGQVFDKMIVLCTEETLIKPKDTKEKNGETKKQFVVFGDAEAVDVSDKSAYEFFEQRIISYIKNDDPFSLERELGIGIENDSEGCVTFKHSELYKGIVPENLFSVVKINADEVDITSSIKEVISIIDEQPGREGEPIRLYLNAQGGARKNVQIVNTVLNMLQSRKYVLSEVSVIEYNDDRDAAHFRMVDATSSYLKNDMATAMNAFLQYGRADMFVEYYDRYKKEHRIETAPEDIVVAAMNNISDAILLSDIDGFIDGIKDLKVAIEKYEQTPTAEKDPFFELIENDIKKSYKELFDSSDIIADLDVLVNWCLNKNLLQQALTILEAKTPFFVFRYGFLYGKKDEETRQALITLRRNNMSNRKKVPDYKFKKPVYYFVNTFCLMTSYNNYKSNSKKQPFKAFIDFTSDPEQTQKIINEEYTFDFANYSVSREGVERIPSVPIKVCSEWYSKNAQIYNNDPEGINKAGSDIKRFLVNYRNICEFRNSANHGNDRFEFKPLKDKAFALNGDLKRIKKLAANIPAEERPFFKDADVRKTSYWKKPNTTE